MHDRARRHPDVVEDREQVIEGVADVQHDGEVPRDGEGELGAQGHELGVARRVLVVVVEAALPDPDHPVRALEVEDRIQPCS